MPYITKEDRSVIDHLIGKDFSPQNGGELQYAIATLIQRYYKNSCNNKPRYKHMEQIMGALSGAAMEHYRCVVAPYEEMKIEDNGAVYDVANSESY
jgi:hypothetical protein